MKVTHLIASVLAVLFMVNVLSAQTVQSGTFSASESTPNYTLSSGSGDRSVLIEIKFDKPFANKPHVSFGVTTMDAAKDGNIRYEVSPEVVTPEGVKLTIKTWADSKIFRIGGSWIAVDGSSAAGDQPMKKTKKKK